MEAPTRTVDPQRLYPNLTIGDWSGMVVRTGTPPAINYRLNAAFNSALQQAGMRAAFARVAVGGAPEVSAKGLRKDAETWAR